MDALVGGVLVALAVGVEPLLHVIAGHDSNVSFGDDVQVMFGVSSNDPAQRPYGDKTPVGGS